MAIRLSANWNCFDKPSSFFNYPTHKLFPLTSFLKKSVSLNPKRSHSALRVFSGDIAISHGPRRFTGPSAVAAAAEAVEPPPETEKLGVIVQPMEKPRLVLKFIWMERNIGLAIDQVIPGRGTIPLSPYYFWPRKDAWEELKVMLESKPWISQKQVIVLLNQATEIINLWQESDGELQ